MLAFGLQFGLPCGPVVMHRRSTTTSRAAETLLKLAGVLAVSLGFAAAAGFPLWLRAPAAAADPISDKQAEAAQIASQISALGHKINVLADQYDGAQIHAQQVASQIAAVKAQVARDETRVHMLQGRLRLDAVDAFTQDGSLSNTQAVLEGNASQTSVRSGFLDSVSINEQSTMDDLHIAQRTLAAEEENLQQVEQATQEAMAQIQAASQAAEQASSQLQSLLNSVKGQLAQLVAQQQAAQARQAQQQAQARLAQQQMADSTASSSSPSASPAPAPSGGYASALSAAESQLGVPYVWGGETPGVGFDCSGLVSWAYGQVGVSLAHYVPTIYSEVQHIPESELQPGDLVFAADLSHVGIYIGSGEMIDAPYTGASVRVDPISYMPLAGQVG
jgi:cell wall-associated NlpC family hydrolase